MRKSIALLLLVAACHRSSTSSPASAPALAAEPTIDAETAGLPLVARLEREARARPTGTPSVEAVMAALERGGLALAERQQVLASTVHAAYCTIAVTPRGAALSVCEYAAEDSARRGLEYSHQVFDRLIPGRRLLLNRKTMLTMTGAGADEARTASTVFSAL